MREWGLTATVLRPLVTMRTGGRGMVGVLIHDDWLEAGLLAELGLKTSWTPLMTLMTL